MTERNRAPQPPDPYARCEETCTHDLASGVLVEELQTDDGPFKSIWDRTVGGGLLLWAQLRSPSEDSEA